MAFQPGMAMWIGSGHEIQGKCCVQILGSSLKGRTFFEGWVPTTTTLLFLPLLVSNADVMGESGSHLGP
jgi:hypothetical protein